MAIRAGDAVIASSSSNQSTIRHLVLLHHRHHQLIIIITDNTFVCIFSYIAMANVAAVTAKALAPMVEEEATDMEAEALDVDIAANNTYIE